MSLKATMASDPEGGVIVVTLHGELTLKSAPAVRDVLRKSLAQVPDAVIVDLTGMHTDSPAHLTVFPAAARAQCTPPVPLLLCDASAEVMAMLDRRRLRDVAVYDTCAHALAAVRTAQVSAPNRISTRLPATLTAPALARDTVEAACRSWRIEDLRGPAALVISELVANVVQHAGTDMVLTAALRGDYLYLSVHDGSPVLPVASDIANQADVPVAEHGHGLHLVAFYSASWGSIPTSDGKTVWAILRAIPVSARRQ